MKPLKTVQDEILKQLQQFDSCTISNAIEQFHVRTRNEGFVDGSVRCLFSELEPRVGYAVTARIRTSATPLSGRCYYDRMDWWSYVQSIPIPRFIVLKDVDPVPGLGALVGEVHAAICVALQCSAVLTNGAVRDLPGVRRTGLQMFSHNVAVSHSYAHVIDFGEAVEVGGLSIHPGDLLHGDQHGIVSIPADLAPALPAAAKEILASEGELIRLCQAGDFSFSTLTRKIEQLSQKVGIQHRDAH